MRWQGRILWTCVWMLVALALVAGIAHWSDSAAGEKADYYAADASAASGKADPGLIARGEYLAKLGDCAACHSTQGNPPFSGGLKMGLPIGAIYTTNITPDKTYGIGRYTLRDFDRALRFGVADGHTLYPAMPYASYAIVAKDDVKALYAYFQFGVPSASVAFLRLCWLRRVENIEVRMPSATVLPKHQCGPKPNSKSGDC